MEWREREHESNDLEALADPAIMQALRTCGLLKYWLIPGVKAQPDLMTWLIRNWNVQEQCFVIGDHRITIDVDDIYFLTGLLVGEPIFHFLDRG